MASELNRLHEELDALDAELAHLREKRAETLRALEALEAPAPKHELSKPRTSVKLAGPPTSPAPTSPAPTSPAKGTVVIVGGGGRLGRLFGQHFIDAGFPVRCLDVGDWDRASELVEGARLVLVSVPIAVTTDVIHQLPPLSPDCLLADLTSIKAEPVKAMLKAHPGPVLGLHPMFGPDVSSLERQVITHCAGRDPAAGRWLLERLQGWGAILQEEGAAEHDEAMALIQAMRHFTTFAYGLHLTEEDPPLDEILRLSSPIYRLELAMVGRLFAQRPELYADIILAAPRNLDMLRRYHRRFGEALEAIAEGGREVFVARFQRAARWFGPFAERALEESKTLIAHAPSPSQPRKSRH